MFHGAWDAMVTASGRVETFTPRQGQALIWAANLLHGGSPVNDPQRSRWSQVTHYFFEGCLHYTPMLSDWPLGPVHWREPLDVASGKRVSSDAWQAERLRERLRRFDPAAYLAANPDVAAAGMNPCQHLLSHGLDEQRRWQRP